MNNLSLLLTFSLVILSLFFSLKEKLGLEKDLIVGSIRATIQLFAVGMVLKYVFAVNNFFFTSVILLLMVYNASSVAAKRGKGIEKKFSIAFWSILCALVVTLGILVLCQAISYKPNEAIPVSGMLVGNSMVAIALVFNELKSKFQSQREEVETKLSLGASPKLASLPLIQASIRTALLPTVDSMKTLGIVQLPGMMTGLILAGANPEEAIKYQLMVAFMLTGSVTISSVLSGFLTYKQFFNAYAQIK